LSSFARSGRVAWIGIRPERCARVQTRTAVTAVAGQGLEGDHYRARGGAARQVTLIQAEHLTLIGALLDAGAPTPELLRRNLMISGINLLALKGRRFQIGEAVLEGSCLCHPRSRMEEVLGPGGYNAMRGHGGLTARIVRSGRFALGDAVVELGPAKGGTGVGEG
jgi:MOSC domain-containing protein YiiM